MEKTSLKTQISFQINKLTSFVNENKTEVLLFLFIISTAAFLRLYRISEYMTFLGDEGRDVIVVRRLLVYADPILVGPGTSIGNMYLGPLYYYLMAPALFLSNYSPVGPAVMVALFGVLTVFLIWIISREWFGRSAAFVAALLYSIAPTIIIYSRSSWNPNIMPFFALLSIYSVWRVWLKSQYYWLIVLGISSAFALNSHYLGLLLFPMLGIFWIVSGLKARANKTLKPFILWSIGAALFFLFLMSPIVIFDARHGWRNVSAIKLFFSERQTTVSARPWNAFPKMWPIFTKITTRLVTGFDTRFGQWVSLVMVASMLWIIKKTKLRLKTIESKAFAFLFLWLGISLIGLGVYKQEIYDHYYGFFFPAPFLLLGGIAQVVMDNYKIRGTWLVTTGVLLLVVINLNQNPLKFSPNMQMQRAKIVAEKIVSESKGEKFNMAVIAERNYDDGYEYFLRMNDNLITDIDPQNTKETITQQLFVVCEMPKDKCDPTHNPKAEVANFGWSKIETEWEVFGTTLFKLIHSR